MYVVSTSDEGDCYMCVPPDPGIEAAVLGAGEATALGASASTAPGGGESTGPGAGESALLGTTSAKALHTFILDSGASRSFFRDRTTLTPLSRPFAVSLADPSGGPVLAHFSTVLSCPAAPSSTVSGLYLPSFSTNLVSGADLQVGGVDQFTPANSPGPSLPYLLGLPLPAFPASRGGIVRSSLLQFSSNKGSAVYASPGCMGPARVRGQGHERYLLLVVDDYSRYTTVFPLRSKGEVIEYVAHQINFQPRVSLPETSPTLLWTGKVGDASLFRL
ncbi:unnamed protein product [Closterium sp. NIES-64]|nr:unnamed protein product [Closterium sp. NIES-64]